MDPLQDDQLLDKYPYMQELARRIDDINDAINRGGGGLEQAKNFLSDLPIEWQREILPQIENNYKIFASKYNEIRYSHLTWKQKNEARLTLERDISRYIKSVGIGLLNDKKILFAKKPSVEMNQLEPFDEGIDEQ